MQMSLILTLVAIPLTLAVAAAIVYLVYLLIRALRKYLRSGEVRQENREAVESLAKALKGHREQCRMTQEFVAEAVGVSRQAVSKWETGAADPSTATCWRWPSCTAYRRRSCCGVRGAMHNEIKKPPLTRWFSLSKNKTPLWVVLFFGANKIEWLETSSSFTRPSGR